jgi:hypothetical protein
VGSRHQEQNRESGKVHSGQYTACWAGLLHLVSEPKTTRLKVGGIVISHIGSERLEPGPYL